MSEDYRINSGISVLFLSLAYHQQYPQYIRDRLCAIYNKRRHARRILLVKYDIDDQNNIINQIYIDCANFETTCILCWSDEEAAQYLYTFKIYENKSDTMLQGQGLQNFRNERTLQAERLVSNLNGNGTIDLPT